MLIVAAIGSGAGDDDQPVSVVGEIATTLTPPVASTAPASSIPPDTTSLPLTQASTTVVTTRAPATTVATAPVVTAPATPAATTRQSVYYENCAAARAAGAAPVYRGDPGYGKHLDRDNDGVGCEN